jgi:ribokinase
MEKLLKITVLGSINHDIVTNAERLPLEGETVNGYGVEWISGGKGANQAVQSALLGAETWFIGCVGEDESGSALRAAINDKGVNTSFLNSLPDRQSGKCSIYVDPQGRNMLVHSPGTNMMLTKEHIDSAMQVISESDFLIVQNEINMDAIEYAIQLAHEKGVRTLLNPAPALTLDEGLYAAIDYITPNETECEMYTGIAINVDESEVAYRKSAEWFLSKGVHGVCITLGRHGAYFYDGKAETYAPAFSIKAIDTTAAGDCFNAGFAVGLASGYSMKKTLQFANACGAMSAMKKGALPSIGTKEEILRFLSTEGKQV